jgi:creatinine amidohydrolase
MSYSVFCDTMADMTYPQIEKAAGQNTPVLFPIGVIEEHGPHLCLGTDIYLAHGLCQAVQARLRSVGTETIIAPPFYWGINGATGGFAGSFMVKPETMMAVLCDTLECLKTWGFEHTFLVNLHGDSKHNSVLLEAIRRAYEELRVGAYYVVTDPFPDTFLKRAGITDIAPYVIVPPGRPGPHEPPEFFDIHAGGVETSLMLKEFPKLVNEDLARSLKSSQTTLEGLMIWEEGGERARSVTPQGYLGDPSDINLPAADAMEQGMATAIAMTIKEFVQVRA